MVDENILKNGYVQLHFKKNHKTLTLKISPFPVRLPSRYLKIGLKKEIKAEKVICLEGINTAKPKTNQGVYAITSSSKFKTPKNLKKVETGYMIGVSAALMLQCKEINLPGLCLMAETHSAFPDGLAAVTIIKELNNLLNLKVDTKPLEREAKNFENKLKEIVEKARSLRAGKEPFKKDDKIIYG